MSAQQNTSVVRRYIEEVWDKNNPAAIDEFLAPHYRRYISPTGASITREGQKQRLAAFRTTFPDIQLTIEDRLNEGDRVAFRSTIRGTHQGMFLDIAPTGRSVIVSLIDVVRIEQGQIIEHWGGPDIFDLLRQLGVGVSPDSGREPNHD